MVQEEEAAAEITRKLEKQEKKCLKKGKKRLAAIALASSENSSTPEECEQTSDKTPKEERAKAPGSSSGKWNERPICIFLQTQEKEIFFQGGAGY
ncbi:Nucleolar protein 56 [Camelus dromedarius]|uniref:Nucleolar protein 56 n=1 Tax=Camelus dromedarius TaxID=9838 RepID=A0A5N4E2J9_CAMDR|nr:Nucleolar protein 56 [Camelus dromedarius]